MGKGGGRERRGVACLLHTWQREPSPQPAPLVALTSSSSHLVFLPPPLQTQVPFLCCAHAWNKIAAAVGGSSGSKARGGGRSKRA